jgi:hypothetical protein
MLSGRSARHQNTRPGALCKQSRSQICQQRPAKQQFKTVTRYGNAKSYSTIKRFENTTPNLFSALQRLVSVEVQTIIFGRPIEDDKACRAIGPELSPLKHAIDNSATENSGMRPRRGGRDRLTGWPHRRGEKSIRPP